ncbi:MAG: DISARM system SNF2-like helicase DrmD [Deltaproteobacteria bacterium]|nr:DISARM system SNF2-like helicase DrmD [Deltaproteobacteria bacterium]
MDINLTKETQISNLVNSGRVRFRALLGILVRSELKTACRIHGLDDSGRARQKLASRLLEAHGETDSLQPQPLFKPNVIPRYAPRPGDIVQVRHRQWLVEKVTPPPEDGHATCVALVCLDDDNQGRQLEVLWELELGASVLQPETHGLGRIADIDPPRYFAAYLHALKWNSVTATESRLFQSPFRAGIKLLNHQLTPLKKALELPRANLFIADDVGLGKTIEAGLVLQELQLRQRVDFVLIICPAAICLQWRSEMEKRFGQHFEIYNREFVARRRSERGFGVNPWTTHNRFIISYQTLRRPEYREPLEAFMGARAKKSLLILDEAHTVAPASASKYAIDSRVTRMIRDVAPKFENRLFLSATPHNGHSNSFSALMEILDPQRFTRGVDIQAGSTALQQVMVRRLKRDLQEAKIESFPVRKVVRVALEHTNNKWTGSFGEKDTIDLGESAAVELQLSELLAEYSALMKPKKGKGQLVFINLQKRLLSSIEAFYRTLQAHASRIESGDFYEDVQLDLNRFAAVDEETYGADDDQLDREDAAQVARESRALQTPEGRAHALLEQMLELARKHRNQPDAKVRALIDWINRNQCPAVELGGAKGKGQALQWNDRRVIIFTEYGDTKRYLTRIIGTALEGSHRGDERIMGFHGAMSDEQREQVQRHFNGNPAQYPVRILLATDAAREGLNLQNHCQDLFHYDVPWNPARMEQRNGRIDRTLQPEPEVRCYYFVYPQRAEDLVLQKVVSKVETIQKELGSLGDVVMKRVEQVLERGIDQSTGQAIDAADSDLVQGQKLETVRRELESQRRELDKLRTETDESAVILNRSAKVMDFRPELLRDAVNVGLELAGAPALQPIEDATVGAQQAYAIGELSESWSRTLDSLRPPRESDEPEWEWRKRAPQPVVFQALDRIGEDRVHLHLEHPFIQRILSRFLAQGYSAQDLNRVTVMSNPYDNLARVIAFGRLSLFGPGAARLHDEIVSVAGQWLESKGPGHLRPFADQADRRAIEVLEELLQQAPDLGHISDMVRSRLRESAAEDFRVLWEHVREEADSLAHEAVQKLKSRGAAEAEALRGILLSQQELIQDKLSGTQLELSFDQSKEREQLRQYQDERKWMEQRLKHIENELESEPAEIEALYKVSVRRLEPVGLVYLWPQTRA